MAPLQVRFHFEVLVRSHKAHRICTWAARAGKFVFLEFFVMWGHPCCFHVLFPSPTPEIMILTVTSSYPGTDVRLMLIFAQLSASFLAFWCVLTPSDPFSQLGKLIWERPLIGSSSVNSHYFLLRSLRGLLQRSSGGVFYTDISVRRGKFADLNIFLFALRFAS